MGRDEVIDIVVTSYFRPDFTWDTLCALKAFTETPYRVIVIDNGSDKDTVEMLGDAKKDGLLNILILLDRNYGLEPAKNYALNFVQSELYVDTDNDILVPPPEKDGDWMSRLIKLIKKDKKLAAVALTPQVFIGANKGEIFKDQPEVVIRDFVGGSMRLMKTEAVRSVGGWRSLPQDMIEANRGEEKYICGKLRANGYKVGYARDIECFHDFGEIDWGYAEGVEHYHRDQWPIPSNKLYGSRDNWYDQYGYDYKNYNQ